jgi:beta-1,4-mannosyltransferase
MIRVSRPPEFILVQVRSITAYRWQDRAQRTKNPPSIPTLALVWLVGYLRGSKVIIDWHNLGYSILALKLGENHLLVRIAKRSVLFVGFVVDLILSGI